MKRSPDSAPQCTYAKSLLHCRSNYGYPLLSPEPTSALQSYQEEGLKIGDVGFVDRDGAFHVHCNVRYGSDSKVNYGRLPSNFKPILLDEESDIITKKGATPLVKSEHITEDLSGGPSALRTFYSSDSSGAILILPSGVIFDRLINPDKLHKVALQYGRQWCAENKCRSVYLITGLYRTRSWSQAYFTHQPGKIVATREDRKDPTEVYAWTAEHGTVYSDGHIEESRANQTIFIRGFKITRKEEDRSWLHKLWTLIMDCLRNNKRVDVQHEPTFVQPLDILDEINRRLLDKFPSAKIAIIHDDGWTSVLDKGILSWDDPVQIDCFVENLLRSSTVESDHEHRAVFLRNTIAHPLTSDNAGLLTTKHTVIQSLRAENIVSGLRRMPFGFYIQVDDTELKTATKCSGIDSTTVEWTEAIPLPHSSDKVRLSVCVAFGSDQTLGGREVLHTKEVRTIDLINSTCYILGFSSAESELSRPSLFLTLGKRLTGLRRTYSDHDFNGFSQELSPQVEKETTLGHDALVRYYQRYKREDIAKAVMHFERALSQLSCKSSCYATALFNLATAKLNNCMFDGNLADLCTPIEYFQKVLESLPTLHPDLPAVQLQLARAFLYRYEKRGDKNSLEVEIERLMESAEKSCAQGSHERQAMNLILQTYKRCRLEHSTDDLDDLLLKELDGAVRFCPEGYFDGPHRLINLGIALRIRFQHLHSSSDVDRSILVHGEALDLIPEQHPDTPAYLVSLSIALFTRFEWGGDPGDLNKMIKIITKAEALVFDGHVDRASCLHALGVALLRRFESRTDTTSLPDIDRSVSLMDEAVRLTSAEHVSRISYLFYLGSALLRRFDLCTDLVDLRRAADIVKQMHGLCQTNHSDGVIYLDKLRNDLRGSGKRAEAANPGDMSHVTAMLRAPLDSASFTPLLGQWVEIALASGSWKDALVIADNFTVPRYTIYRVICERLETISRMTEASECFCQMMVEMAGQINLHDDSDETVWVLDFRDRCTARLEGLGDMAMNAKRHEEAVLRYSVALSLNQTSQGLLIKRSKAFMARNMWNDALNDADELITLDSSSHLGHEMKYISLRGAARYAEAIDAFETMFSVMSHSSDPEVRELSRQYVDPKTTRTTVRRVVTEAIRESPQVLINTTTGHLCDKSQQATAFESSLTFADLVFSVTTSIDHARVKREAIEYYRYAMFSHKWESNEPTFHQITNVPVYDLEEFPTHHKLQMFCKVVRDAGFHWAWSDVCCIDKASDVALQNALAAMFGWYQRASLTVIFLLGVRSPSRPGDLLRCIWNTRAWALQEYHASKVVRFYNEDWTTYLNLDIPNHKESPEILSEMEKATGVSAQTLSRLQPGLKNIREKLRLASLRETARVEDMAYSLLGIFSVSLPIAYGEGNQALGGLLAKLLPSSGDTSILAWTGRSGNFNSCLPATTTVFNELPTTHIPSSINGSKLNEMTARLRASSLPFPLIMKLFDDLLALPAPSFTGQRLKLPCISFALGPVSTYPGGSERAFRAKPAVLGTVKIQTKEDISRLDSLVLIHPWIDFLLDRRVGGVRETAEDEELSALQVLARLRQPFGALLLAPVPNRKAVYTRVASESRIVVQVEEITSTVLKDLVHRVRMLEVE